MNYKLQSVRLNKKLFNEQQAINFVKQHYTFKKIDDSESWFKFRQINPQYLQKKYPNGHYVTKKLNEAVDLIIYYY